MSTNRLSDIPLVSLDYKRIIDQRCTEGKRKLVQLAEACNAKQARPQDRNAFNKAMNEVLLDGANELQALFAEENAPMKLYYQQQMTRFLQSSVFWRRVYEKPLGYAGDYLMMDMVYRNEPLPERGGHQFSDLLDAWFLNEPTAQAARNRHGYLARTLKHHINTGARKIANLASGPCREVHTVFTEPAMRRKRLEFAFVDFDDEALSYANVVLNDCRRKNIKFQFINANLLNLILGRRVPALKDCDYVYSTGFADYLPDRLLAKLLEAAYSMLAPGGTFLLGQMLHSDKHPDRYGLEWVTDWNLIYRTREEMYDLFTQSSFSNNIVIDTEPSGLIMFAHVQKPKGSAAAKPSRGPVPAARKAKPGARSRPKRN